MPRILRSVQGRKASVSLFHLEGTSLRCGGLAQLGERLPCKQEVSGSIPLISTKRWREAGDSKSP